MALEIRIPGDVGYLDGVRGLFRAFLKEIEDAHLDEEDVCKLELALQEACVNAVRHADVPGGNTEIGVEFQADEDCLTIRVRDQGRGFDPDSIAEPEIETLPEKGYGVCIIRRSMDLVESQRGDEGFVLTLKRFLATGDCGTRPA